MKKIIFVIISVIAWAISLNAQDQRQHFGLVPPPTNRNFSFVVAASWFTMAGSYGETLEFSLHYFKPRIALDVYYERAIQDWFRGALSDENEYQLLDNFFSRLEFDGALTFSSKVSRKGSFFYRGRDYEGGNAYDVYSYGEGNAATYNQIRFGVTNMQLAFPTDGLDTVPVCHYPYPTQLQSYYYSYSTQNILSSSRYTMFHLGIGTTKVFNVGSPGTREGTDRIGMRKMYIDIVYAPFINYRFLTEKGNEVFPGYIPTQYIQKPGFSIGIEMNRLNAFSGYWMFEIGMLPGIRPYHESMGSSFLLYFSLKAGLETGWPLFNRNYE
ncbi:MAG: hypothetical protein KBB11_00875 [Bacteroidales bacterium]|nr:hypothetical protein [Bacteroidales bacterium]HOY38031.1 hypothetical protein [Bacteroidales bacterium]HQP04017.1 hypothetical protein [Bacteroidales bacterium]